VTADYAASVNWGAGTRVSQDGIRAALTPDVRWTAEAYNIDAQGIEEVLNFIGQPQPGMTMALHSFSNPRIDIQGDTGTGDWLLWGAIRVDDRRDQVFQREEITYKRTDSGWKISSINLHFGATLNPS